MVESTYHDTNLSTHNLSKIGRMLVRHVRLVVRNFAFVVKGDNTVTVEHDRAGSFLIFRVIPAAKNDLVRGNVRVLIDPLDLANFF